MKKLVYIVAAVFIVQGCSKSKSPAAPPYEPDKTICYTVIDKQTNLVADSAQVTFVYGNTFADYKTTGSDGKACFTIPTNWVVNEVNVTKPGYVNSNHFYNSVMIPASEIIYLDKPAYIRLHVENISPALSTDKIEIYYPKLAMGSPPDVHNGIVNTTYVSPQVYPGNIGLYYYIYSGNTPVDTVYTWPVTIGNDTIDITINY